MIRFPVWVCVLAGSLAAAETDLSRILRGIENRYNRARTLEVLFEQTYGGQGRTRRTERGELFLRKPGRMRWEYSSPQGKLFVTDGEYAYLYTPSSNRVEKMKVKESDDIRTPLAFLLGRLDFNRDFKKFIWRKEGNSYNVVAEPKSERAPYSQVEFLVDSSHQIRRLIVTGHDRSVMEFEFGQEKINPPLSASLFEFTPPPGAAVVEAMQ